MSFSAGKTISKARGLAGFVTRYGNTYQIFGALGASRLLSPEMKRGSKAGCSLDTDLKQIDEISNGTTIQRVSGLCLRGYNNNQLLRDTDAVSMAHSLEVRVPFLDPVVADIALSLPDSAKLGAISTPLKRQYTYKDSGAKRILFDVGRNLLPQDFDSQIKRGFAMPFDSWLKGPLREILMDTLSERQVKERGLFNSKEVATVRDEVGRNEFFWGRPWLLMMLELWMREVVENIRRPSMTCLNTTAPWKS